MFFSLYVAKIINILASMGPRPQVQGTSRTLISLWQQICLSLDISHPRLMVVTLEPRKAHVHQDRKWGLFPVLFLIPTKTETSVSALLLNFTSSWLIFIATWMLREINVGNLYLDIVSHIDLLPTILLSMKLLYNCLLISYTIVFLSLLLLEIYQLIMEALLC